MATRKFWMTGARLLQQLVGDRRQLRLVEAGRRGRLLRQLRPRLARGRRLRRQAVVVALRRPRRPCSGTAWGLHTFHNAKERMCGARQTSSAGFVMQVMHGAQTAQRIWPWLGTWRVGVPRRDARIGGLRTMKSTPARLRASADAHTLTSSSQHRPHQHHAKSENE